MESEEFVLKERDGERTHRTIRVASFLGTAVLVALFFNARACSHDTREVEREKVVQQAETDRFVVERYTTCLQTSQRAECDRAYYPERREPLTAAERDALEAKRAERALQLYTHCTGKTRVADDHCDDEVAKVMRTVEVER
jgi:hypothetical protein